MAAHSIPRHVILTGPPGMGKTTVVRKVVEQLVKEDLPIQGFYTEELRKDGKRIGFDCVSVTDTDNREPLARVAEGRPKKMSVGNYNVDIESFEKIAFPSLSHEKGQVMPIWIIDEVGKMEMFSDNFTQTVVDLVNAPNTTILAVVPVPKGRPTPILDEIRQRKDVKSIWVSKLNRDNIIKDVTEALTESYHTYAPQDDTSDDVT
ncbi:unnamed protein product [Owenia fusiformis]|uniref:Uncharacterized protein n=1 Tax=Owenia fusiformis TaxID=6347 RepID=A0A8J1XXZ6_OWEFU|nr:unnamed protein product [Owenia fusiformis]